MKKITIIAITVVLISLGIFSFVHTRPSNSVPNEWSKLTDQINGWEIQYPKTITEISLVDDIGPEIWTNNIIFYNKDNWVMSVYAAETEFTDTEEYLKAQEDSYIRITGETTINGNRFSVGLDQEMPSEEIFLTIQNKKIFIFHTNSGAPAEKILESFRTFE